MDSLGTQGAERGGMRRGGGVPLTAGKGLGRGLDPYPEISLLFDLKMERFAAVFRLHLTEETRMQLQKEEVATSCLTLATPMVTCYIIALNICTNLTAVSQCKQTTEDSFYSIVVGVCEVCVNDVKVTMH